MENWTEESLSQHLKEVHKSEMPPMATAGVLQSLVTQHSFLHFQVKRLIFISTSQFKKKNGTAFEYYITLSHK